MYRLAPRILKDLLRSFLPDINRSGFFSLDPPEFVLVDTNEHGISTGRDFFRDFSSSDVSTISISELIRCTF